MLRLPCSVRIFAVTRPIHFSTDIDGLVQRVRAEVRADPFNGDLFCFFNLRRTRVKLLVWDHNGFWVLCKRLERGRFERLDSRAPLLELTREDLVNLLIGIDTKTRRFRGHFLRELRIDSRAGDEHARVAQ
jgi:hypothetical protein